MVIPTATTPASAIIVTPRTTQAPVDNVKIFLDFIQSKKIKENYDASPSSAATPPSHNPDGVVVSIVQGGKTMISYYDDDTQNIPDIPDKGIKGITYIKLSNDLLDSQTLLINMYKQFIGSEPQLCYTNLQPVTYRVEFFGRGFSSANYENLSSDPNAFFIRISKNIKMLTWYIAYSIFTNGDVNILRDMGALVIANYILKTTACPELWSLTRLQSNSVDTSVIFNMLQDAHVGLTPVLMKDIGKIFELNNYFQLITYPVSSANYQKLMNAAKSYLSPSAATDMQNILNSRDQTSGTILIEDVGRLLILTYYNGRFDADTC